MVPCVSQQVFQNRLKGRIYFPEIERPRSRWIPSHAIFHQTLTACLLNHLELIGSPTGLRQRVLFCLAVME